MLLRLLIFLLICSNAYGATIKGILIDTTGTPIGTQSNPLVTNGRIYYVLDTASSDSYTISFTPAITSYTDGMIVFFKANTINTGACSLNINGLGAIALKSLHDHTPEDGYIEANEIVMVIYDGISGTFQIINPDANP